MSRAVDLVHVVGVRHHSPACARLVQHVIASVKPSHVLVEGPSDMNARVDELLLGHTPPVAVFTFAKDPSGRYRSVWSPFCEHSPEWIALHAARDAGARPSFMDLPAWHPAFEATDNRYGDRKGDAERARSDAYLTKLIERFRVDDTDTLWDHVFEIGRFETTADLEVLEAKLAAHFDAIRGDEPAGPRDGPREAFMLACLAWAARDAEARGGRRERGGVVAVCGGWHRPALVRGLGTAIASADPSPSAMFPEPPQDGGPSSGASAGSYLVPYSHRRLDSLSGYASGMPSPGFYGHVWREGESAADHALMRIARRLRDRKQPASTADLIACRATAEALARMRGHAVIGRADLLDAVAATLVKDALDVEVPWARRGTLRAGTDPVLVEVVAELAGDEVGVLARGTPRPPLAADVDAELAALDLSPADVARSVEIDLAKSTDLARSRTLHRLRVLDVPGFTRESGPRWATDKETRERWVIRRDVDADARFVEVAGYGATLASAARARLEERAGTGRADPVPASEIAAVLGDALFAGLIELADRVMEELAARIRVEPLLAEVGAVLRRVHGLHAHGAIHLAAGDAKLEPIIAAAYERALWLLEGVGGGPGFPEGDVRAIAAIRDVARADADEGALAVFERRVLDVAAAPAIRGACLGALVSVGARVSTSDVLAALRRTPTKQIGDLLSGLFALAREEMTHEPALLATVDELLLLATEDDFFAALPALRFAFTWFPPRERAAIADRVAGLHGASHVVAHQLLAPTAAPARVQASIEVERRAREMAAKYGLLDVLDQAREDAVDVAT